MSAFDFQKISFPKITTINQTWRKIRTTQKVQIHLHLLFIKSNTIFYLTSQWNNTGMEFENMHELSHKKSNSLKDY